MPKSVIATRLVASAAGLFVGFLAWAAYWVLWDINHGIAPSYTLFRGWRDWGTELWLVYQAIVLLIRPRLWLHAVVLSALFFPYVFVFGYLPQAAHGPVDMWKWAWYGLKPMLHCSAYFASGLVALWVAKSVDKRLGNLGETTPGHPTSKSPSSGFTLVEIVAVVAIVAVLAAILFPVLTNAKRQSHKATCIAQLRQVVATIHLYSDIENGMPPYSLAQLAVPDPGIVHIMFCPMDKERTNGGQWCAMCKAASSPCTAETSYAYVYGTLGPLQSRVGDPADEERYPAILACIIHGEHVFQATPIEVRYGTVLQARRDGSVRVKKVLPGSNGALGYNSFFTP